MSLLPRMPVEMRGGDAAPGHGGGGGVLGAGPTQGTMVIPT